MADNFLFETNEFSYEVQELNESGQPKSFRLKGIFQKADTPNGNRRSYPRPVLESCIRDTMDMIQEGRMLGEINHPDSAGINLEKASHKITKLEMQSNGHMYGEAEILQTPAGKILEGLIKSKVKLGISSRGFGSVKEVNGLNEVQSDYKLVTFDIVSDPSTPGAYPNAVYENKTVDVSAETVTNLDRVIKNALAEGIETPEMQRRHYVGRDDTGENMFYIVEGEKDSYGYLNFHASHDYHMLLKKANGHESISLSEENLSLVKRLYGNKIYTKLASKIEDLGYNSQTLNLKKED